mgnify:CR=1
MIPSQSLPKRNENIRIERVEVSVEISNSSPYAINSIPGRNTDYILEQDICQIGNAGGEHNFTSQVELYFRA